MKPPSWLPMLLIWSCRKGHTKFTFSNDSADAPDGKIIAAFPYKRAGSSYIVHQDSSGNVRVGRL